MEPTFSNETDPPIKNGPLMINIILDLDFGKIKKKMKTPPGGRVGRRLTSITRELT
jgi:hypothetical protein